uniref:Uncharacterized protein n=1 Tax=Pipistrellus kuhlii TaxID=59472 RepID=A0A7J7WLX6_PIPKU|nr:hypothetical protein mPipKuh1_007978 [Pipistrellus kuhlii]
MGLKELRGLCGLPTVRETLASIFPAGDPKCRNLFLKYIYILLIFLQRGREMGRVRNTDERESSDQLPLAHPLLGMCPQPSSLPFSCAGPMALPGNAGHAPASCDSAPEAPPDSFPQLYAYGWLTSQLQISPQMSTYERGLL